MSARPIVASFADGEPVRRALGQLHAAGVERDDISLLMAENNGHTPRFGLIAGHKGAEGAAFGAALGAVLGGIIGGLIALADVAGPDWAALGITVATLAGVGLGGALGSIFGAAFGLRIPEYKAKLVDASTRAGHVMIAVWVADDARAERVTRILAR
ncbi:MAG TPA: hypothetical protein VM869_00815 [Enhygromyxa sp.]|nr:hypothetical protein [Enhygromyxa sp.]